MTLTIKLEGNGEWVFPVRAGSRLSRCFTFFAQFYAVRCGNETEPHAVEAELFETCAPAKALQQLPQAEEQEHSKRAFSASWTSERDGLAAHERRNRPSPSHGVHLHGEAAQEPARFQVANAAERSTRAGNARAVGNESKCRMWLPVYAQCPAGV